MGRVILGISSDYHDSAAALVVDGEVVAAAEEERFSRIKHDSTLPREAVAACLEVAGLAAGEVDHVVYYEKPILVVERYLEVRHRLGPRGVPGFIRDSPRLIGRNLLVGYRVRRLLAQLGARRPPAVHFVEHHRSHAAAAFHPSPFATAAILTADGLGEWATASIGHGTRHGVQLLEEQRFPHSLGLVYSLFTAWCGFAPNDGEYKLMGLAPYGEPRFLDALAEVASVDEDGRIEVDAERLGWFAPHALRRPDLHQLFGGPPRGPDDPLTAREADLAATVQRFTEEAMLAMARRAHDLTGESSLCLAGGVALNCVANGRLLREGPFGDLWVQPAAGDSGSAVGAALSYWHDELGHPHRPPTVGDGMRGAALGPANDPDHVTAVLEGAGVAHRRVVDRADLAREVARRIADGAIVGWVQGRMEFGPRALGNRSLLADPRDPSIRERLNLSVKGRESFRPFAPAVLADRANDWFELDHPSPYMLVVAPVRQERRVDVAEEPEGLAARGAVVRSDVPACTHVDGSARIQTVDGTTNPGLHRLLVAFEDLTGCPMLVNTSFNVAGEPIVHTVEEALATARRGGLDLLVVGDVLVEGAALQPGVEDPGRRRGRETPPSDARPAVGAVAVDD